MSRSQTQQVQYAVYQADAKSTAYFNPLHFTVPQVGDVVHGHTVVLVGTLDQAQACVAKINAALPVVPSIDDLLAGA